MFEQMADICDGSFVRGRDGFPLGLRAGQAQSRYRTPSYRTAPHIIASHLTSHIISSHLTLPASACIPVCLICHRVELPSLVLTCLVCLALPCPFILCLTSPCLVSSCHIMSRVVPSFLIYTTLCYSLTPMSPNDSPLCLQPYRPLGC
jgi:hypothetical protein